MNHIFHSKTKTVLSYPAMLDSGGIDWLLAIVIHYLHLFTFSFWNYFIILKTHTETFSNYRITQERYRRLTERGFEETTEKNFQDTLIKNKQTDFLIFNKKIEQKYLETVIVHIENTCLISTYSRDIILSIKERSGVFQFWNGRR